MVRVGQLHLDRKDFDEAKEYINKVLQLSPRQHDSYALLLKAVLNLKTGQFHQDKHTAKVGPDPTVALPMSNTASRTHDASVLLGCKVQYDIHRLMSGDSCLTTFEETFKFLLF